MKVEKCESCGGNGKIPVRHVSFGDYEYKPEVCPICKGKGKVGVTKSKNNIHIHKYWMVPVED